MAFAQVRGRGSFQLEHPSAVPIFRKNFPFHTHRLFSSKLFIPNFAAPFAVSISIPKRLIPKGIKLTRPFDLAGDLLLHFGSPSRLEWQLDVDQIVSHAFAPLGSRVGYLSIVMTAITGSHPTLNSGGREAWIVTELKPLRRQFWYVLSVFSPKSTYQDL